MDLIVPPTVILQLRKVTTQEAAKLLAPYRGKLTPEAYDHYLSLATPGPSPPEQSAGEVRVSITDPSRRRFMAAAWVAGASMQQLAELFSIRRQTVQDQVSVELPKAKRNLTPRLYPTPVRWEFLLLLRAEWESDRGVVSQDLALAAEELARRAMARLD